MCTLTWWSYPSGERLVLMNRDEQRSRPDDLGVRVTDEDRLDRAYPVDAAAGGTWFGANAAGLVLALLNHYPPGIAHWSGVPSRGRIIPAALGTRSPEAALDRLNTAELQATNPFTLIALGPQNALRGVWDRHSWSVEPLDTEGFASSSSWRSEEIVSRRLARWNEFVQLRPNPAEIRRFHSTPGGGDALAMERTDACTRSITEVHWTRAGVRMAHIRRQEGREDLRPPWPTVWEWRPPGRTGPPATR